MMRIYIFLVLIFGGTILRAQDDLSPKKHISMAEQLTEEGKLAAAALHYESAWLKKNKKLEWLNAAGELYLRAREYRKAVEAFSTIRDSKLFPLARFNYALALQQSGDFDDAIPEFLLFLNSYEGKDRPQMQDRVEDQIAGCTLAIKQSDAPKSEKYTVEHMSANINSTENDFAPVPFGDDILYFTSAPNGQERILRSQQLSVDWSLAAAVENLPIPMGKSFGNGAFSADGSRFYFAQWNKDGKKKKAKVPACAIYVIQRVGTEWSAPLALSDGVNTEGGIATSPFVLSRGEKDLVFFASNREGGRGGLDIWYTTFNPNTKQCDKVQTVGSLINTEGDEVAPFYDVDEKALYFASNGRPTHGGYDIFKSTGSEQTWSSPENMGVPFNTGADDYYFIKNKTKTGGFFASNRSFGMEKVNTRDDDVYFFRINESRDLAIEGKVFEKEPNQKLENARVSLFERRFKEEPKLLSSIVTADGQFNFALLPHKAYSIEVEKEGYRIFHFEFKTDTLKGKLTRDFTLEKVLMLATLKTTEETEDETDNKTPDTAPTKPANNEKVNKTETKTDKKTDKSPVNAVKTDKKGDKKPENIHNQVTQSVMAQSALTESMTEGVATSEKTERPRTTNAAPKGTTFKVQILAYENMDIANRRRIARITDLGDIETEKVSVNGKNLTRVMLATFGSRQAAVNVLKKVKERTLEDAFIVRYENGKRQ